MWIVLLIVIVLVIAIARLFSGGNRESNRNFYFPTSVYYQKKVLSQPEQSMYWKLQKAAGTEKVVLSQVAFSQFIRTKGDRDASYAKYARARQKVADFVICNKDFSIHAIVEVDDSSHDEERDAARDEITEEAGIKTYRCRANALLTHEEILEIMK